MLSHVARFFSLAFQTGLRALIMVLHIFAFFLFRMCTTFSVFFAHVHFFLGIAFQPRGPVTRHAWPLICRRPPRRAPPSQREIYSHCAKLSFSSPSSRAHSLHIKEVFVFGKWVVLRWWFTSLININAQQTSCSDSVLYSLWLLMQTKRWLHKLLYLPAQHLVMRTLH